MPALLPSPSPFPTLGYLTRRQLPGTGTPPGTEPLGPFDAEAAAVAG
jgi:hypothetical protein